MRARTGQARQSGFTLIELVIVIVIVSVLGVGLVSFISNTVQGVSNTADRQQRAKIAWIASEKLSALIRNGLPNSFRLSDDSTCLEFIPTLAGSDYLSVPLASSGTTIDVVNFPNYAPTDVGSDHRLAVYPSTLTNLYSPSTTSMISGGIISSISPVDGGSETGTQRITLGSAHQFVSDSPSQRVFVVQDPRMVCFEIDGFLNLYSGYGFNASMTSIASAGSPVTIVNRIDNAAFDYSPGSLTRAGVVTFSYEVTNQNAGNNDVNQVVSQEVQIRNVP